MKLIIEVTQHPKGVRLRVINQPYFGQEFFKGIRYFHSSKGFLLASEHDRIQAYPRISKLGIPADPKKDVSDGVILPRSNFLGLYLEELFEAVEEYNEQKSVDTI